ncbi:MAG: hypothetical protein GY699_26870 [Desulfobacteraceae bacterium]|nr:hypothetical protein [Desulfobacteraceae bacterium]
MAVKSGRVTDRFFSFFLYLLIIIVVSITGLRLINYAADIKFYHLFLLKWENTLKSFSVKSGVYPDTDIKNQKAYMENLILELNKYSILIPHSNSHRPYIYRVNGINPFQKESQLFILGLNGRIIIYNIPETTFKRLDKFIDGKHDMIKGNFIGKSDEKKERFIGQFIF